MNENGDDKTSEGPPPRLSPPRRKRESIVIEGRASEARPLGATADARQGAREALAAGAIGGLIGAALALAGVWLFAAGPDLGPFDRREAALDAAFEAASGRITALEAGAKAAAASQAKLAALEAANRDLQTSVETLKRNLADQAQRLKASPDPAAKLAALEAAGRDLQASAEAQKRALADETQRRKDAAAALDSRLSALEGAALRPESLAPVAADARAAKAAADKALAAADAPQTDPRLVADEADIAALRARLDKFAAPKAETRVSPAAPTATGD
jgi:colicin import membrane protein